MIDLPNDGSAIVAALNKLGQRPQRMAVTSPYGDGKASRRIVDVLRTLPGKEKLLQKRFALPDVGERAQGVDSKSRPSARLTGSLS